MRTSISTLGDCNDILTQQVFPRVRHKDYKRALCLLDPYGIRLEWRILTTAGRMKTIDLFLNFPIEGINRNVLWSRPKGMGEEDLHRMTLFWGDESWREVAYAPETNLFGDVDIVKRPGNEPIVKAFGARLREVAGFAFVPEPIPMRDTKGAVVYYLFFASHNEAGDRVARSIFGKYRRRGLC